MLATKRDIAFPLWVLILCTMLPVVFVAAASVWPKPACAKCGSPGFPQYSPLSSTVVGVSLTGYASDLDAFAETTVVLSADYSGLGFVVVPVAEDVVLVGWLE